MSAPRDIEVTFEELDPEHGGRMHPLVTNSRSQFYYLGHDWDCRVEIISPAQHSARVGVRAYLAFLSPADHFGRLQVGSAFLLREGHRTIGFGTVTRLLDLETSAQRQRSEPGYYSWHGEAAT